MFILRPPWSLRLYNLIPRPCWINFIFQDLENVGRPRITQPRLYNWLTCAVLHNHLGTINLLFHSNGQMLRSTCLLSIPCYAYQLVRPLSLNRGSYLFNPHRTPTSCWNLFQIRSDARVPHIWFPSIDNSAPTDAPARIIAKIK